MPETQELARARGRPPPRHRLGEALEERSGRPERRAGRGGRTRRRSGGLPPGTARQIGGQGLGPRRAGRGGKIWQ
eukprot:11538322-Alexandrium_andersonii.AAC.1